MNSLTTGTKQSSDSLSTENGFSISSSYTFSVEGKYVSVHDNDLDFIDSIYNESTGALLYKLGHPKYKGKVYKNQIIFPSLSNSMSDDDRLLISYKSKNQESNIEVMLSGITCQLAEINKTLKKIYK